MRIVDDFFRVIHLRFFDKFNELVQWWENLLVVEYLFLRFDGLKGKLVVMDILFDVFVENKELVDLLSYVFFI